MWRMVIDEVIIIKLLEVLSFRKSWLMMLKISWIARLVLWWRMGCWKLKECAWRILGWYDAVKIHLCIKTVKFNNPNIIDKYHEGVYHQSVVPCIGHTGGYTITSTLTMTSTLTTTSLVTHCWIAQSLVCSSSMKPLSRRGGSWPQPSCILHLLLSSVINEIIVPDMANGRRKKQSRIRL